MNFDIKKTVGNKAIMKEICVLKLSFDVCLTQLFDLNTIYPAQTDALPSSYTMNKHGRTHTFTHIQMANSAAPLPC